MKTIEKGQINVHTENIFPIIKKFLYSDHEIFLRELISNATDATQKLKKLSSLGEVKGDLGELQIEVKIDAEKKTLTISDKGIGMTADEVNKYINQIAFSSAEEFLEKFKETKDAASIIGHFGLGFYSAFMVAKKVDLITKSHKRAKAVKWSCDGSPEYTLDEADKKERGTDVVLHIAEDSEEFLQEARIEGILNKYCKFLPIPIKFGTQEYTEKNDKDEDVTKTKDKIINNTSPAWTKSPSELKEEDYIQFYQELYPFTEPPLFWIHLNVDYPFNLTGILYFPKLNKKTYEIQKNRIQLYSNQVFVTDSVEEIVPEYLMMLQGVIDSPDIPLNVSRSYLQSDANVKKITSHISKKVADKLNELFTKERKSFEEKWESVGMFVKYGMISDEKFFEKASSFCLYENVDGKMKTLEEYKKKIKKSQTDKNDKLIVLYSNNVEEQDSFIHDAKDKGYDVLKLDSILDNHFMQQIEMKETDVQFKRVDADTTDQLIEKDTTNESVLSAEEEEKLKTVFEESIDNKEITVLLKPLSPGDKPVMITRPEFSRRMKEMSELSGGQMAFMGQMPEQLNLIVNTNHPLSSKILKSKSRKQKIVKQLYDLALLSQNMLKGSELTDFINRSVDVMAD